METKNFNLITIEDVIIEIQDNPGITEPQINYSTAIGGSDAPVDGATKNTGALANLDAVDTDQIVAGAVTKVKMALASVDADIIAAGAITENKLYTGAVTADKIASNAVTSAKIMAGAITAGKIAAGAVTANEINVSDLSAISANIGTITSGTITGVLIQTSSFDNTGVKMSNGLGGIRVYGQSLSFHSGSTAEGWLYADGAMRLYSASGRNLFLSAGSGTIYMECTAVPNINSSFNLGSSSYLWGNVFTQNIDFGNSYYINRNGAVVSFNNFTNLSIGGYTFRPVGFTFKDGSGNNKYLIVLATADPV